MARHLSRAGGAASMRTRAAARRAPAHARWRSHLLDHPVGAQQDRGGDRHAERLCGTQVENGFELVCLLDGKVDRIDALEDLVDEHGRATAHLELIRTVPDQASGFGDLARSRQGERLPCRKIGNRSRAAEKYRVLLNHGRIDAAFGHGQKSRLEITRPVRIEALQADLQRAAGSLERRERQPEKGIVRIDEDSRLRDVRHGLLEQLEALGHELGQEVARAVTFPPGCRRLATTPVATASPIYRTTTGIAVVACLAASVPGVPWVTMTSTFSRTSSAASAGSWSYFSSAQRTSMAMFLPSTYPRSRRPERNASIRLPNLEAEVDPRNPIRTVCCCARAETGQAAAAPPSSSRRGTVSGPIGTL